MTRGDGGEHGHGVVRFGWCAGRAAPVCLPGVSRPTLAGWCSQAHNVLVLYQGYDWPDVPAAEWKGRGLLVPRN